MKNALLVTALFWLNLCLGQTQVVSSFTVLDYWSGKLLNGKKSHKSLIPSGGELHGFQLSPSDLHTLNQAIVVVGLNRQMEPWLADWAKANGRESDVIWLNTNQSNQHLHTWLNPESAKAMVIQLNKKLSERFKISDEESQVSINKMLKEIDDTALEIVSIFSAVPQEERKLVAYHQSLESFADYFKVKVVATIVDSAVAECADPSIQRYSEILKTIKKENVRLISFDEGQNSRIAVQLTRDSKLPPPISLSFEYLQPVGKEGDTWPSMMIMNARKIAEGLKK